MANAPAYALYSEVSFISEAQAQLMQLPKWRVNIALSGIGESAAGKARRATRFVIRSCINPDCKFEFEALVVPRVTGLLPSTRGVKLDRTSLDGLELADPTFLKSAPIDLILGADVYGQMLRPGVRKITDTRLPFNNGDLRYDMRAVSCHPYPKPDCTRFPLGANSLLTHTYVDDIFDGAHDLITAIKKRKQIVELLSSAGISLDKWAANDRELLPGAPLPDPNKSLKFTREEESVKTLSVKWNSHRDAFTFNGTRVSEMCQAETKRTILSAVSRLFDPLGWIAPIVVTGKIIMQDIRILPGSWDAPVPDSILEKWRNYCASLSDTSSVSVSRWLGTDEVKPLEIHGFCDASMCAYAACIYVRIRELSGTISTQLLAAKTKVAPLKTRSIPNLELCGAVLLIDLVLYLRRLDWVRELRIFLWSDSQIVLAWLGKHPCHWKTFVANRVSYIQTELPSAIWNHVGTKLNPADLVTCGADPHKLNEARLWWHGSEFLMQDNDEWPKTEVQQRVSCMGKTKVEIEEPEILTKYSTFPRLIRMITHFIQPLIRFRRRRAKMSVLPQFVTAEALQEAKLLTIKLSQTHVYRAKIELLKSNKELTRKHPLSKLSPFVDEKHEILRVGGRLANADLSYELKHPPILHAKSHLSRLIVQHAHKTSLHGGFYVDFQPHVVSRLDRRCSSTS